MNQVLSNYLVIITLEVPAAQQLYMQILSPRYGEAGGGRVTCSRPPS